MINVQYAGYARTGIRETFGRWAKSAEGALADTAALNGGSVKITMHDHRVRKQKGQGEGFAEAEVRPSMTIRIPRPEINMVSEVRIKGANWSKLSQMRASIEAAAANRLEDDEVVSQLPRDCVTCVHRPSGYVAANDAVYVAESLGLELDENKVYRAGKRLSRLESRPLGDNPREAWATFTR